MTNNRVISLSDAELLAETARVAEIERRATAELLSLVADVDRRKLYLGRGYPSLFVYCTQALHLSESAAYSRITAARAARDCPIVLTLIADGAVTLTTVSLLAAHLTDDNHEELLEAASHKSRREVERLVASLDPQPDVVSSVRRLPQRGSSTAAFERPSSPTVPAGAPSPSPAPSPASLAIPPAPRRAVVAPLAADRYLLKITLSAEAHEKLDRARDLRRHQIPNGDPALIVDRALTRLVEQLERTKQASVGRPRAEMPAPSRSRHVPAAVRRAVWRRDHGRCAFVGADGRCEEKGFLEFHHVVPFAAGGATDADNLQLRCRAHNAYEATLFDQSSEAGRSSGVNRKSDWSSVTESVVTGG